MLKTVFIEQALEKYWNIFLIASLCDSFHRDKGVADINATYNKRVATSCKILMLFISSITGHYDYYIV